MLSVEDYKRILKMMPSICRGTIDSTFFKYADIYTDTPVEVAREAFRSECEQAFLENFDEDGCERNLHLVEEAMTAFDADCFTYNLDRDFMGVIQVLHGIAKRRRGDVRAILIEMCKDKIDEVLGGSKNN